MCVSLNDSLVVKQSCPYILLCVENSVISVRKRKGGLRGSGGRGEGRGTGGGRSKLGPGSVRC